MRYFKFLLLGIYFGVVLTKAQVISWFKIQNMFFLREPDLYLIIGSAVITGALSLWVFRRLHLKTQFGKEIVIPEKALNKGTFIGGFIFGLGWFITGACPGPIFAQIGAGEWLAWLTFIGAFGGTFIYAWLKPKLPH